ncbi:hypothetical protein GCM10009789_47310 [Kribbella sancticallisti]|uniref:Uncharacterized protein n=1 Tax=Kribbella sancticallisti TaxID=460087 RepID=A0ABN2DVV7_9ACTN
MSDYVIKLLSATTWDAFAQLAERHNGVWNGCWCTWVPPGLIGQAGDGLVEAYPQDTQGKKTSASFLYKGTRKPFEDAGFSYDRPKGKNHCVMSRPVSPS